MIGCKAISICRERRCVAMGKIVSSNAHTFNALTFVPFKNNLYIFMIRSSPRLFLNGLILVYLLKLPSLYLAAKL